MTQELIFNIFSSHSAAQLAAGGKGVRSTEKEGSGRSHLTRACPAPRREPPRPQQAPSAGERGATVAPARSFVRAMGTQAGGSRIQDGKSPPEGTCAQGRWADSTRATGAGRAWPCACKAEWEVGTWVKLGASLSPGEQLLHGKGTRILFYEDLRQGHFFPNGSKQQEPSATMRGPCPLIAPVHGDLQAPSQG